MQDRRAIVWPASTRGGQLFLEDRDGFKAALASWPDGVAVVRLEEVQDVRRPVLNAFYWAAVLPAVSDVTGYTDAESHHEMKALHLAPGLHVARGGSVCWHCARVLDGSTKRLSTREEARYIERILVWLAHEFGAVVTDRPRVTA